MNLIIFKDICFISYEQCYLITFQKRIRKETRREKYYVMEIFLVSHLILRYGVRKENSLLLCFEVYDDLTDTVWKIL